MRLELGALSALAAMTSGVPAASGQTVGGTSGARRVILAFSYTVELVQGAGSGPLYGRCAGRRSETRCLRVKPVQ